MNITLKTIYFFKNHDSQYKLNKCDYMWVYPCYRLKRTSILNLLEFLG